VLPLTPVQQGLMFHSLFARHRRGHVRGAAGHHRQGVLDQDRLREAVHTVIGRHPNLAARFYDQFGEPVQVLMAEPQIAWRYVDLRGDDCDPARRSIGCARRSVPRCVICWGAPPSGRR
jgi:glycopeptidolipid biosynthesis protein